MEWMKDIGSQLHLLYIDETGFNIWTSRTRGRSRVGQPAVRQVEGQRGRNITVSLAVSPRYGLVHSKITQGGMTQEIFNEFLSEISALMGEEEFTLLMDNARAHNDCQHFKDIHHFEEGVQRVTKFLY